MQQITVGATADEIAFLYATSEGENIVARGLGLGAGDNVVVLPVAISHGNLAISVTEAPEVSQPEAFSERGRTVVVPRSDVKISERGVEMRKIPTVVSAGEIARALR